jgi:hypothetical protein
MKIFAQRFQELSDQLKEVEGPETRNRNEFGGSSYQHIAEDLILNWAVKARTLISSTCGKESEHGARASSSPQHAAAYRGISSKTSTKGPSHAHAFFHRSCTSHVRSPIRLRRRPRCINPSICAAKRPLQRHTSPICRGPECQRSTSRRSPHTCRHQNRPGAQTRAGRDDGVQC